jgi:carbon monoxide dehydrogenase subunit G
VTHVERSIEVEVPVRTAYDQWTQFEEFPRFMSGVQEVRQVGDALTHWVAEIAGVRREWDAAILEQVPDQKVSWAATSGATNAGAVYFMAVGPDRTQVRLTLDYEPEGIVEKIGDVLDVIDRQAVADLDRFKEFIEQTGSATGGWRGRVEDGDVQAGSGDARADSAGAAGVAAAGGGAGSGGFAGAGDTAGAGGSASDVEGDLIAVGPTAGTYGTVDTERGPARTTPAYDDEDAGVGHSGDPVAVEPPTGTATSGPTADAASSSSGIAGFGTDTGMSSDEPASGAVTGNPDSARHAAGTGTTGTGVNTGVTSWTDEPGARTGTTEATTDPVGESWSSDPDATDESGASSGAATVGGAGDTGGPGGSSGTTEARGGWDEAGGTATDPMGESWSEDTGTSGGADRTDAATAGTARSSTADTGTAGSTGAAQASGGGVRTGMGGARGPVAPERPTA